MKKRTEDLERTVEQTIVIVYCIYVVYAFCITLASVGKELSFIHLFPVNDFVCMYNLCSRVWPDVYIFCVRARAWLLDNK